MYFDDNKVEIVFEKDINDVKYYDFVFSAERNVEMSSLIPIQGEIEENSYAIYVKGKSLEICVIKKIDLVYDFAFIQIYKSNIPETMLKMPE